MDIYLPIAQMPVDPFVLLAMGGLVGFLSGLLGIGGGFLMTPLLIFIGIPPAVSVATQSNQLVAASVSGVIAHWRRRNVDFKLGTVMLAGGAVGSAIGVAVFAQLKALGQIDLVISLTYVLFLGMVATLMMIDNFRMLVLHRNVVTRRKLHEHTALHRLPLRMRFPRSRLYISALLPLGIGFVGGLLVAIMGIGGGFILVPAMIYLLGMPVGLVAGTSLFQIIFTTGITTLLQAVTTHAVDVVLAAMLIVGGVIGAQIGTRLSHLMKPEYARLAHALIVLVVAVKLTFDLFARPENLFSVIQLGAQ
ncbi:MAG TPA: sulfite exporter TauE/SafE family protein [Alphaproteobacteria bacterium]|jgi:uncharacterized membrane protein YfcA|nr:sulfite exporter TauE/SafE family protein [Alphaproteobacteria bacterium]